MVSLFPVAVRALELSCNEGLATIFFRSGDHERALGYSEKVCMFCILVFADHAVGCCVQHYVELGNGSRHLLLWDEVQTGLLPPQIGHRHQTAVFGKLTTIAVHYTAFLGTETLCC